MESWPAQSEHYQIDRAQVAANIEAVRVLMRDQELDGLIINSADRYQNEYTPLEDNHRYELTGFTGSTALVLIPVDDRVKLYVDGRYHLQADSEVDSTLIEVVKVQFSVSVAGALLDDAKKMKRIGYESDRVTLRFSRTIEETGAEAVALDGTLVAQALKRPVLTQTKAVSFIPGEISGRSTKDKLKAVFDDILDAGRVVLLLTALDDIAWLSDARGYHFAYQSSFAAIALARPQGMDITVDQAVNEKTADGPHVSFTVRTPHELILDDSYADVKVVQFDPNQVSKATIQGIQEARPDLTLREKPSPVVPIRAIKTPSELEHMKESNARSSRAITNTISWVRQQMAAGQKISELDFHDAANEFYQAEGARDLSFHTIAATGANTAIIHFSDPSLDVPIEANNLMLLDSGALYEGGLATDITRCFIAGGKNAEPSQRQKHIYTTALKGMLQGMMAIFPKGTKGSFIDALVRAPIYRAGLDYAHGTGHGVGVHVHEPGVGISPGYTGVIRPGHVCSIEPGIYIEGFGGVRHENVVVFEEHPEQEGFLRCQPLNYVGFDTNLIDASMFDEAEAIAFESYMSECKKRGTDLFE